MFQDLPGDAFGPHNAIADRNPSAEIPRYKKPRMPTFEVFEFFHDVEVTQDVLRNCVLPFCDPGDAGCVSNAHDLTEFLSDKLNELFIVVLYEFGLTRTSDKRRKGFESLRSPAGKEG